MISVQRVATCWFSTEQQTQNSIPMIYGTPEGGEVAVEGLGGVGGDEEEGAVVVGVFPSVFDGGAGLADAAHAVDGALAFDDDGAFGGEVLAEFGEELIAAFEQGAGKMTN